MSNKKRKKVTMNWEELIKEDKKGISDDIYTGIIERIVQRRRLYSPIILRKRHISISIVAGILLGILSGAFHMWGCPCSLNSNKAESANIWYQQYYINDVELECIEQILFQ